MASLSISQIIENSVQRLMPLYDTARIDSEVLVAHALNFSRTQLYTWSDKILSEDEREHIEKLIGKRYEGVPVAYIVGQQEFWSLEFKVTPDTLIPRPETEHLVEFSLENIPVEKECRIADLGTGSGAIAISIAKERPLCQLIAVDESEVALKVAIANAKKMGISNVLFEQSNWFESLQDEMFDLIVSNPPYIEEQDKHLLEGDVASEPRRALVSGSDGLDDIRQIIQQAKEHLKSNAMLVLEHGWDQAVKVRSIFEEQKYVNIKSINDLAGIERLTVGSYEK